MPKRKAPEQMDRCPSNTAIRARRLGAPISINDLSALRLNPGILIFQSGDEGLDRANGFHFAQICCCRSPNGPILVLERRNQLFNVAGVFGGALFRTSILVCAFIGDFISPTGWLLLSACPYTGLSPSRKKHVNIHATLPPSAFPGVTDCVQNHKTSLRTTAPRRPIGDREKDWEKDSWPGGQW